MNKRRSQGSKLFLESGLIKESQIISLAPDSIVAEMRKARASGTFTPGIIDMDFDELEYPLAKSIEIARQILELAADTDSMVVMTFPSPHPIVIFEAELRRLGYQPADDKGMTASAEEGWIMYAFITRTLSESAKQRRMRNEPADPAKSS